jgi:hypothetical protein
MEILSVVQKLSSFAQLFFHFCLWRVTMETISYHKSSFAIPALSMIAIAMIVESTAIHFLLGMENLLITLCIGALHIVTLWWIIREIRAVYRRPHTITDDTLSLRLGTLYAIDIPRQDIIAIRPFQPQTDRGLRIQNFDLIQGSTPKIVVELRLPLPIYIGGLVKRYTSYIGITTDNDNAILALHPSSSKE